MDDANTNGGARLRSRRADIERQIDDLNRTFADIVSATESVATDDEHDPEGQTIAFERAQTASLLAHAHERLAEIAAAEWRLRDGTYGICVRCAQAIPDARLAVRPAADTCVRCAGR